MRADGHTRPHERVCTDPRIPFDPNRFDDQVEGWRFVIMIAGAQEGALRNAHMIFNDDRGEIEHPTFLTEPHMVTQSQLPGECDSQIRLEDDSTSHARAKA